MSSTSAGLSLQATLGIVPSTFIRMDPNNGFAVLSATGTTQPVAGIAQKYALVQGGLMSGLGGTENLLAAAPGGEIEVFFVSDICKLKVGAGGCIPGSVLVPDSNGNGIIGTTGNWYGAMALNFGLQGDLVDVLAVFGKM